MCIRENIIMELRNRGYEAVLNTRIKNGVAHEGILVHDGRRVVPFLYPDRLIEKMSQSGKSLKQVVDGILRFY